MISWTVEIQENNYFNLLAHQCFLLATFII